MQANEIWLAAVGFEGFYEVSNLGRVRSLDREVPTRGGTRIHRGKVLVPTGSAGHYLKVGLSVENRPRTILVHRLVADAWLGARPEGKEVNHRDGQKHHNAAVNLEYVTKSQNMAHALREGLVSVGEQRSSSKYTEAQVAEVIRRVRTGETQKQAGAPFGMSQTRVSRIVRGKTWRHLQPT